MADTVHRRVGPLLGTLGFRQQGVIHYLVILGVLGKD